VTDLSAEFDRWRQASVRSDVVVERGEEPLLTSIMPIIRLPEEVSFYEYDRENKKFGQALETVPHPHAMHNRLLVSFAAAHEIQAHLPPELTVSLRGTASFATFLEGKVTDPVGPLRRDANAWAVRMLRESFEAHLATRGLLRYLASAGTVMFFPKDLLADDRVYYTNAKGKRTYKQVVGESKVLKAHWHLGMRAVVRLGEAPTVRLRPYVVLPVDARIHSAAADLSGPRGAESADRRDQARFGRHRAGDAGRDVADEAQLQRRRILRWSAGHLALRRSGRRNPDGGPDNASCAAALQVLYLRRTHHGFCTEDAIALCAHADARDPDRNAA
jgi:hypothetical protein